MCNDPIAMARFWTLMDEFPCDRFIETGTNLGATALAVSERMAVVTIEIDPVLRGRAIQNWKRAGLDEAMTDTFFQPNGRWIHSIIGDSARVLAAYLRTVSVRFPCFYLDAHGGPDWPLLGELKAIAGAKIRNCVIIIHDFKVPGKPWQFDSYGGQDLDLPYVKPLLDLINPKFKISFNEEAEGNKVGIMYATPV